MVVELLPADLLDGVPPARLFDEFGKLFQSGHALAAWQQMEKAGNRNCNRNCFLMRL